MGFSLPIPPDTAIITDDAGLTGAALLDPTTGAFLGFVPLANFATAQESGTVMLDGTIGLPDNANGTGHGTFGIYDGNLALITNAQVGPTSNNFLVGTATDRTTYFYVIGADGSNNLTVYQVNASGTTTNSWSTGLASGLNPNPCAVDRSNAFFYFTTGSGGNKIRKLNLSTGAVTDLATLTSLPTAILIDSSGNFYINRDVSSVATIEKYNSSFVLQSSVNGGPTGYSIDRAALSADDAHLFTWTQKSSGANGTPLPVVIGAQFTAVFGELDYDRPGGPVRVTVTSAPWDFTITSVSVTLTPVVTAMNGDVVIDILNNDVSIVNSTPPTIVNGTSYSDSTLSGWTTAVSIGDDLTFVVTSADDVAELLVELTGGAQVTGGHPSHFSAFRKIRLSDLAVIGSDVTGVPTESNSSFITEGSEISNSCPLLITGTPTPDATLIVEKETDGNDLTDFDFTATGPTGTFPGTFTLHDGQSITADVYAGTGYGVAETAQSGWSNTVTVSNGSPVNNITVGVGETVTVIFTNHPYSTTVYPLRRQRYFILP